MATANLSVRERREGITKADRLAKEFCACVRSIGECPISYLLYCIGEPDAEYVFALRQDSPPHGVIVKTMGEKAYLKKLVAMLAVLIEEDEAGANGEG